MQGERTPLTGGSSILATHGHNGTTSTSTSLTTHARDVNTPHDTPPRRRRRGVCATAWIGAVETFVVYPFHWVFRLAEGPGYPRGSLLRRAARSGVQPQSSTDTDASKAHDSDGGTQTQYGFAAFIWMLGVVGLVLSPVAVPVLALWMTSFGCAYKCLGGWQFDGFE